jgi:hypothetical protein
MTEKRRTLSDTDISSRRCGPPALRRWPARGSAPTRDTDGATQPERKPEAARPGSDHGQARAPHTPHREHRSKAT